MTISYQWLHEYLPLTIEPDELGRLLTSLGLEVESVKEREAVPGGLSGLVIGEVLEVTRHPNADKLSVARVLTTEGIVLQIVCGAPNVAAGQKVIVAPVGTTIHPVKGEPLTIRKATIRGVESEGMICAEDEVGLGENHEGILVLPPNAEPGQPLSNLFASGSDPIYEIGITPNRMDAMSHLGVARDICAYLSVQRQEPVQVRSPYLDALDIDDHSLPITASIENTRDCARYAGVSIVGVKIGESPDWLTRHLLAIGIRPINNVVDITNFILHETGQPLHAFDASAIKGNRIIVRNLPEGSSFLGLDGKERKLSAEDLMICNGEGEPMCIGGVFGGLDSGISESTTQVFLESAWFNPVSIRKSSFRHHLRTDAATRFEKGVDIGNTVNVLKRAALLMREIAGGRIASELIDIYPHPAQPKEITLNYSYLYKLSGKRYEPGVVRQILLALGFGLVSEETGSISVTVPTSKRDVELPADLVEEIMRIDGYDRIEIPASIRITPSVERSPLTAAYREKIANQLAGQGWYEIFTNSITNAAYYDDTTLASAVKMLNSLSAELNIMRPSMLHTSLQSIAHNLNRKNLSLRFFEFGKVYWTEAPGRYREEERLCLYATGNSKEASWNEPARAWDIFQLKGHVDSVLRMLGVGGWTSDNAEGLYWNQALAWKKENRLLAETGKIAPALLKQFDIKQPVFFAQFHWETLLSLAATASFDYQDIPKFPQVQRDLAIIVDKNLTYAQVETAARQSGLMKLRSVSLFDLFESEKLGAEKKSLALSLTFQDNEKTLTDIEIDAMMQQLVNQLEKKISAEIRR